MVSRDRVMKTIRHEIPDRVPLDIWMYREDVKRKVLERYGSMENFFERLDIDMFMAITPPPNKKNLDFLEELMNLEPHEITEDIWLDPDAPFIYKPINEFIKQYGKDKALFVHTWGVVESLYSFIGIERTLSLMVGEPEKAREIFQKAATFSRRVAENIVQMDIDVLHITGDVGANKSMLFSPNMWRELVAPFDQQIIQPALDCKMPISLHSCGYSMPVIDDWIKMGVEVLHPIQESAGMDPITVKKLFGKKLTLHCGLDLRMFPKLSLSEVEEYVCRKVDALKPGGGFIFATDHTVQMDTSLEILEKAYDAAKIYGQY